MIDAHQVLVVGLLVGALIEQKSIGLLGGGNHFAGSWWRSDRVREAGITLPGIGWLVRGSISCWVKLEKSPRRCAAVATTAVKVAGSDRICVPCQEPKKNVRSFLIGPPEGEAVLVALQPVVRWERRSFCALSLALRT